MSRLPAWRLILAAASAAVATGCAEYTLNDADEMSGGTADQSDVRSLRVDVYPSSELASELLDDGVSLMQQSFRLENSELDALGILQLQAPEVFDGFVFGFEAYPTTAEVSVPGDQLVPVEAEIQAYVPGTPMGHTAVSDPEDGSFELQLTPTETAYQLAVVPRAPDTLPFMVDPAFIVESGDSGVLDFELDYGVPLYGRISQGETETPLPGLRVQAFDLATGIGGPIVETDSDGTYELRVLPGSYELLIDGDTSSHLPDKSMVATLEDHDEGLRLDASYNAAAPITVLGEVQDEGGLPLEDVLVRFTSTEVYDDPGATYTVAVTTGGGNGAFSLRLLPGTYEVEFIPPYEGTIGPLLWPEEVELIESYTELNGTDPIVLPLRPRVRNTVLDADGQSLANVIVRAEELGFDGYAYNTVTDDNGDFSLSVAGGELQWSFTPPSGSSGASTFLVEPAEELSARAEVALAEGLTVAGCIQYEDVAASYMPLELRDSDEQLYATSMTDLEGCFSVRVDWDQSSPDEAQDTGE